jgi:1,2-dihydroxy-3-keto-5-methylthiopentene dioxygenase
MRAPGLSLGLARQGRGTTSTLSRAAAARPRAAQLHRGRSTAAPLQKVAAAAAEARPRAVAEVTAYSVPVAAMHWIFAGGTLACFATVQYAMNTKDKSARGKAMMYHKSVGVLLLALLVPRVAIRLMSRVPKPPVVGDGPRELAKAEHLAGKVSHFLLYGFVILMPTTGLAMGYFGGNPLPFFGLTVPGTGQKVHPPTAGKAFKLHKQAGQLFEYLVPIHLGAVGMHALRGQNIVRRILPFPK